MASCSLQLVVLVRACVDSRVQSLPSSGAHASQDWEAQQGCQSPLNDSIGFEQACQGTCEQLNVIGVPCHPALLSATKQSCEESEESAHTQIDSQNKEHT